jgi:RND family efflux transporter MFP subunit
MKKFLIVLSAIIITTIVAIRIVGSFSEDEDDGAATSYVNVEVAKAAKGDLYDYTTVTGNIAAEKTVYVIPTLPALVENVYVEVGDYVEEDALLFDLDTSSVESQITQASAGVTSANAGVDQGNLAIQNAQDALAQAEIAYEMAKANYDMSYEQYQFAVNNLAKYAQLYEEGIISEVDYEQMKLQASDSTIVLLDQQLLQAEQALSQAQLGVSSAVATSQQAQAGVVQAEDGLNQAEDALEDMTFLAPISGYITAINVSEDAYASSAQAAMTIEAMDKVMINISVTENVINKIAKGDEVEVTIESLEDKVLTGTIKTLSPSANQMTLLYDATIEVENGDHLIKPGMFANVQLSIDEKIDAIYVESNAIVIENDVNYVYVVDANGIQEKRAVTVGLDTGIVSEIISGLSEGEEYVTSGVGFIDEETLINVVRGDE